MEILKPWPVPLVQRTEEAVSLQVMPSRFQVEPGASATGLASDTRSSWLSFNKLGAPGAALTELHEGIADAVLGFGNALRRALQTRIVATQLTARAGVELRPGDRGDDAAKHVGGLRLEVDRVRGGLGGRRQGHQREGGEEDRASHPVERMGSQSATTWSAIPKCIYFEGWRSQR